MYSIPCSKIACTLAGHMECSVSVLGQIHNETQAEKRYFIEYFALYVMRLLFIIFQHDLPISKKRKGQYSRIS